MSNIEEIKNKMVEMSYTNIQAADLVDDLKADYFLGDIIKAANLLYGDDGFSEDREPYNWVREIYEAAITAAVKESRDSIEDVRFEDGEIQAYGVMPNTNEEDWYFVGYEDDLDIKGLHGIGVFID